MGRPPSGRRRTVISLSLDPEQTQALVAFAGHLGLYNGNEAAACRDAVRFIIAQHFATDSTDAATVEAYRRAYGTAANWLQRRLFEVLRELQQQVELAAHHQPEEVEPWRSSTTE
jgi:hypothetical protein